MYLSWQRPEHFHIETCKRLARCINSKDIFLCAIRWHVRAEHLQYLHSLDTDAAAAGGDFVEEDGAGNSFESKISADTLLASWESDTPFCRLSCQGSAISRQLW